MHEWPWSCAAAYVLDLCLGDPAWLPHPVIAVGWMIQRLEVWLYPFPRRRVAGLVLLLTTTAATVAVVALILTVAADCGRWVHAAVGVVLLWMAFATRSLVVHGGAVRRALDASDLPRARRALARMVSRDTEGLQESGIARACIESLAENLTDGCLSPFLFGLIGGPIAAWALKAVSTLDSMVGYRNERYRNFGWASARCDDALHFLPARTLWLLLPVASWAAGESGAGCWRSMRRDGDKTPSPNSGLPEAGVAGALGIELGGPGVYTGVPVERARLNRGGRVPAKGDILRAQRIVLYASALPALLAACFAMGVR